MRYCLDSQYCSSVRALLLFQLLSDVLSRALRPKIRSKPAQLLKECSRSTVSSETEKHSQRMLWVSVVTPSEPLGPTWVLDPVIFPLQLLHHQDLLLLTPVLFQLLLEPPGKLHDVTGLIWWHNDTSTAQKSPKTTPCTELVLFSQQNQMFYVTVHHFRSASSCRFMIINMNLAEI